MQFDSKEEQYYSWYLEELEEAGYINSWVEAKTYPLGDKIINKYQEQFKTKSKEKEQTILNGCEYTPDFEIKWNPKAAEIFFSLFPKKEKIALNLLIAKDYWMILETDEEPIIKPSKDIDNYTSIIEIKASFDQNNMTRLNGINRKWMYQKYSIFVNLVKVPEIFKDTFVPKRFLLTDSGKQQRIIHFPTKTLEEYVNTRSKG